MSKQSPRIAFDYESVRIYNPLDDSTQGPYKIEYGRRIAEFRPHIVLLDLNNEVCQ